MTDINDPMEEIRASFFIECDELLEALQDGLQAMQDGTGDSETINVVFRAVHSIKGGAGAFGLQELVRYAHRFETALDEIRSDRMALDAIALKVFFQSADHLSDLVHVSRNAGDFRETDTESMISLLDEILRKNGKTEEENHEPKIDFQPTALTLDLACCDDETGATDLGATALPLLDTNRFLIKFKPDDELFETGNEPFHILRILDEMGLCVVTCDSSSLPPLAELAPETSYLSWTIELRSNVDTAEIASAFEFVEGLCQLEISNIDRTLVEVPLPELGAGTLPEYLDVSKITPFPSDITGQTDQNTSDQTAHATGVTGALGTPDTVLQNQVNSQPANAASPAKSVVRVDLDRIERLVNLVGELVINQAMLSQSLESAGLSPHSDAMNGLEEFQRLTRDIQDSVIMIRAQPVKSLFQRMSRIVRESSAVVDKDVRLLTDGEDTEVDKTVIDRLADPLTHMIRNAVDHGLETTQNRLVAGKPAQGQVTLTAAHRSGRVIIEVSDDGGGIDRPRVLQSAIDKGLISSDAELSENEVDNLLFLPGFSTTTTVSNLSGRGVGMDVVRTAIQALGGRITTTSTPGIGTTFSISLPLTLAVLDGMVVQVANETLVLPLNTVLETRTLTNQDVEMIRPGANVIRARNEILPLFDLGYELGYRARIDDYDGAVVLLIALDDDSMTALVIDSILDQRQVVIKGLDDSFYRAPGVAAATILGDGQIALILDTSDLISNAIEPRASSTQPKPVEITA